MQLKDTWEENTRLWGIKFLIEDFYYKINELEQNKAVAVDKMQTFWMAYSPGLKRKVTGEDKKLIGKYLKWLRGLYSAAYESGQKLPIEEIDGWFSSEEKKQSFLKIYNSPDFDFKKAEDYVLAFNLADGVLNKSEIREYVVLESIYLKHMDKGQEQMSNASLSRESQDFSYMFNHPDIDHLKKLLYSVSEEEIKTEFMLLNDINLLNFFKYQKDHNYPFIYIYLYSEWVSAARQLLQEIISKIIEIIKTSKNVGVVEKYFPNIYNRKRNEGDSSSSFYKIYSYQDDEFSRRINIYHNELNQLIYSIFSEVLLGHFDICHRPLCKKLFIKFPKKNRKYCSNYCAAYDGTYKKRAQISQG